MSVFSGAASTSSAATMSPSIDSANPDRRKLRSHAAGRLSSGRATGTRTVFSRRAMGPGYVAYFENLGKAAAPA